MHVRRFAAGLAAVSLLAAACGEDSGSSGFKQPGDGEINAKARR